jgi:putative redox protein
MPRIGRDTMSSELQEVIKGMQDAFRNDPSAAKTSFTSSSSLQSGFRSHAELRHHRLIVDEPQALAGTDAGPNPVELILAALGTCQEITYRAYATAMGISLDNVSVKLTGDLDLRGFFAVDPSVRPGYERICGTVTLESNASPEELRRLRDAVNAHCPVLDILANPVSVQLDLSIKSPAVAETT